MAPSTPYWPWTQGVTSILDKRHLFIFIFPGSPTVRKGKCPAPCIWWIDEWVKSIQKYSLNLIRDSSEVSMKSNKTSPFMSIDGQLKSIDWPSMDLRLFDFCLQVVHCCSPPPLPCNPASQGCKGVLRDKHACDCWCGSGLWEKDSWTPLYILHFKKSSLIVD